MGSDILSDCRETRRFSIRRYDSKNPSTEKPQLKRQAQGKFTAKIRRISASLVVLNLATAQLSPSAPNSIIAIALGQDFACKG